MKTIFITGSTDGIGKLAAILLAKEGHTVYLHGRKAEKLQTVIDEVKELAQTDKVMGYTADFSDFEAVRQLADKVLQELPAIDILINNAGVFKSGVTQGKNGLDIRLAVNYFAPLILTNALLPLLQKRPGGRIINLSSAAQAPVSMPALRGQLPLSQDAAYAQSKLALTMWSFHLAQAHPELNVLAVNPGSLLNTKMAQEAYGTHWSSADKGAQILYDLAVADSFQSATGQYFDNDRGSFGEPHPDAKNPAKIQQLLEVTQEILA